ncbi:MAG: chorismate mutase [Acidimicrobiia bacterium]|nr:chorismate mutase [Acidimicrobiia bacterium]
MTPEETGAALDDCRDRIDVIDRRIVMLLNERARVVEKIGDLKQTMQMRVYEPKREEAVFANITAHNGGPLRPEALKRIYERVIDEMRTLQRDRMAAKGHEAK